jgi:hypothetical protein
MNDTAERDLMARIQKQYGPLLDSTQAASGIPAAFFAALIANETGGNPDAKRFEPHVLLSLWEVLLGRKAAYGSIGRADVVAYVTALVQNEARFANSLPADAFQRVDALATSWGLTQIMGYEAIAYRTSIDDLRSPVSSVARTAIMLKDFAKRDKLDVAQNFSELFDCWNTGRPHAPTADPTYIPDGLARLALYQSLETPA